MKALVLVLLTMGCTAATTAPPPAVHAAAVVIAGPEEPGERLVFTGRVLDDGGRPLARAAVVAYHTDRQGLYNPRSSDTRVPRLRNVAITDAEGAFRFSTIRPAGYPEAAAPAHVHLEVVAPAHHVRFLEYWFEDDPRVTPARRAEAARGEDTVVVRLARDASGAFTFHHDIRLRGN